MSFISVLIREQFLTVVSDGRVSGLDIQIEDYRKFLVTEDGKRFVAFAGDRTSCEEVARGIMINFAKGVSFRETFRLMVDFIKQKYRKTLMIKVAYGGVGDSGELEVYSYDHPSGGKLYYKPTGNIINFVLLSNLSKERQEEVIEKLKAYLIETGDNTPTGLIQAQKLLNNYVATFDDSVNKNTFRVVIKKYIS